MGKSCEIKKFPRTDVGGISMPRMIMGSNWLLGYSHTTGVMDKFIRDTHSEPNSIKNVIKAYLEYDIDAIMIPSPYDTHMVEAIKRAEDETGKNITRIFTPGLNVSDTKEARKEAEKVIKDCKKEGGTFLFPHHSTVEQIVNKNTHKIDRLPDYLSLIRENDMLPGLSAHMPEIVIFSDANEYDVETYIQIYNCLGFLMQIEVEYIHKVIWEAKKPVIAIKPMAAGRTTPFIGITFSYATLRERDMVCLGAFTEDEVHEDVEIALAAIERRRPNTEGRSSPNKTVIMK